jgi:sporulation protein YlmC with PRC-barrel domain
MDVEDTMQHYRHSLVAGCAALLAVTAQAQNPARDNDAGESVSAEYRQSLPYQEYLKGHNLRASELIGAQVRNPENENLGEIEELVIASGRDMVVLSVGGVLHVGDKLVAVPYEDLRVSADGDTFYVNRTREQLEAAPAYSFDRQEAQPAPTAAAPATPAARDTDEHVADRTAATRETATAQTDVQKEISEGQREIQRESNEAQHEIERAATQAERNAETAAGDTDDNVPGRTAATRETATAETEIQKEVSEAQREIQRESNEAEREIQRAAANDAERSAETAAGERSVNQSDDRDADDLNAPRASAQRPPSADADRPQQAAAATRSAATAATALGTDDYRGSKLIGATVHGSNGEKIAEIDDLVLSTADKKVHAVLSVGGVAGIGAKLVSIPLDDLKISAAEDPQNVTVRIDTTVDQLEGKPEFHYDRQAALDRTSGPGA